MVRHFLQLPPFAKGDGGGFSCVGATIVRVMSANRENPPWPTFNKGGKPYCIPLDLPL